MANVGKKYSAVREKMDRSRTYELAEAISFLTGNPVAKFDETAEIAFRLGVDSSKSDQMVRGTVSLPHGSGKDVRVIVFAQGDAAEAATGAGADTVGFEDLLKRVQDGWTDFDVVVATPDAMKEVRKLGRVLGPRGLMPNPKSGTVTDDTATAVQQFKAGRVEFKMDKHGNVHVPFGKLSFSADKLQENCEAVVSALWSAKPAASKGIYIKKCTVSSTMGVGLRVNIRDKAA